MDYLYWVTLTSSICLVVLKIKPNNIIKLSLSHSFWKISPILASDLSLPDDTFVNDFDLVIKTYKNLSWRTFYTGLFYSILSLIVGALIWSGNNVASQMAYLY